MKTTFVIFTLVLFIAVSHAQEQKKQIQVQVKKIETVNGVKKVTDTFYVTDDLRSLPIDLKEERLDQLTKEGQRDFMIVRPGEGGQEVIIRNGKMDKDCSLKGDTGKNAVHRFVIKDKDGNQKERVIIMNSAREMTAEEQAVLKEATKRIHDSHQIRDVDQMMKDAQSLANLRTVHEVNVDNATGDKKIERIIIIRELKAVELTEEDKKMLQKTTGVSDGKLAVDEMKFFPNPNDGKFNLSFQLKDTGDTGIEILNTEGKSVYSEKLVGFTGSYSRDLDISHYPKGIYFVRIEQNQHAQIKKIVLE